MKLLITKYCLLKDKCFFIDGENLFCFHEAQTGQEFLTALYRQEKVNYPKFFKMDNLSKTGFLAAELLLKETSIYGETSKTSTGIFISNRSASLDTDETYQSTIGAEYFPSPSVFVYTLPNIVMGEIAIKHKLYGENTFFVSENFDSQMVFDYVCQSFKETGLRNAIVGWVDYYRHQCEAFLMLVEKQDKDINQAMEFSVERIKQLNKL
jgi:hypothetical protein